MDAAMDEQGERNDRAERLKRANVRTALVFASIAVVFFAGILAAKLLGDPVAGMSVLGLSVLIFLVFAIGRNLRK